jgi:hypothetical protein
MAAIEEVEDLVRRYLRDWEDSDLLPSEAAREFVTLILQSSRLCDARSECLTRSGHVKELLPGPDDMLAGQFHLS